MSEAPIRLALRVGEAAASLGVSEDHFATIAHEIRSSAAAVSGSTACGRSRSGSRPTPSVCSRTGGRRDRLDPSP